jgi:hypothetical protein
VLELLIINLNNNGRQIAKFIIPMLKNQTVNSNLHFMFLVKIQACPTEAPLLVNF